MRFKHICGCITNNKDKIAYYEKICPRHNLKGRGWIILQHPKEKTK